MNTAPSAEHSLGDLTLPALQLLAETIDREFQRREPVRPSYVQYAAARLGLSVTELSVASEAVEPAVAHAVGQWMLETQKRYDGDHVGADPSAPATTERLPGATGDLRAFGS